MSVCGIEIPGATSMISLIFLCSIYSEHENGTYNSPENGSTITGCSTYRHRHVGHTDIQKFGDQRAHRPSLRKILSFDWCTQIVELHSLQSALLHLLFPYMRVISVNTN